MPANKTCAFCKSAPAEYFCDFTLGWSVHGWNSNSTGESAMRAGRFEQFVPGKGLPCVGSKSKWFRCDAPLCEKCRVFKSVIFFCPGGAESIDHCPRHAKMHHSMDLLTFLTPKEADRERRRIWKNSLQLAAS